MRGRIFAALAALAACAMAGCGAQVVSDPFPDEALVLKIRAGTAGGAQGADAESAGAASAFSGEWGNLTGRFVYDGPPPNAGRLNISRDQEVCGKHNLVNEELLVGSDGGLANVVVYVYTKHVPVHADYEATANDRVRYDNEHCRFEPHILPIRLTQTLELHNSDPLTHNSNMSPLGDTPTNPTIGADQAADYQFQKQQNVPVPITCSIHPWMKGFVLPRENPYAVVSAPDGTFTMKNLPAGKLEFQVWQEKAGALAALPEWKRGRFKMEIQPGDNDLGEIQVSPSLFE